jgi:hypothetical protein
LDLRYKIVPGIIYETPGFVSLSLYEEIKTEFTKKGKAISDPAPQGELNLP